MNAVNAAPFLGCWWLLWEGVRARTGTQGRGEPWRGGPLVCGQGVNRGACVGVRTVASWGACERQRARGLGAGGAGPEGVVKRQRSGARSVPWRRALVSTGGGSCGRGLLVGPGCGCPA